MRVVVLATTFPGRKGDGTPAFVLTLAEELSRIGHEVSVVTPRVPGAPTRAMIGNVRVIRFRYFPRRWEDLADGAIVANLRTRRSRWLQVVPLLFAFWWATARECRRMRAEVVHAHWVVPGGLIARALPRPYLVTAHGADAYSFSRWPFVALKRVALRRAHAVIPVSTAISDRLEVIGFQSADPIPMGVDLTEFSAVGHERDPREKRILFVGRLVDKKGVDVLLRALGALPDTQLVIIGDGPDLPALQGLAQTLGIQERVEFRGQRPRAEVVIAMFEANVVVIPSRRGDGGDEDGVPVVLPEAIAAGAPVVATDAGGIGEHLVDGRTGWLVPAGEVDSLAVALGSALTDPEEAGRRANCAREELLPRFEISSIGRQYDAWLRSALSTSGRPAPDHGLPDQ